jgi:TolA-binding protein
MRLTLFIIALIVFGSCGNRIKKEEKENDLNALELKKETFFDNIQKSEQGFDYTKAMELGDTLQILIDKYKGDTVLPYLYFELGQLYVNYLGDVKMGINTFLKIKDEFPDNVYAPKSIFIVAFLFEERLKKKDEAEDYYKMLIRDYPDNELAADAQRSLEMLHFSTEELVKKFKEQQQDTSIEASADTTNKAK